MAGKGIQLFWLQVKYCYKDTKTKQFYQKQHLIQHEKKAREAAYHQ